MTGYGLMHLMRLIRSASFNDEMAAERLRELSQFSPTDDLARHVLDIAQNLDDDSRALEQLYQALASGRLIIRDAPVVLAAQCNEH